MSEKSTQHLYSLLEDWERTITAEIISHDMDGKHLFDDREVRRMLTQLTALKTGIGIGLLREPLIASCE